MTTAVPTKTDADVLREQLERTQAAYISTLMEKNFLQRAVADLNFHHNAHDGIVYLDKDGNVVYANPYFLKMMNIEDPAQLLNKPLPGYMWFSQDDPVNLISDVKSFGFVRERELNLYNSRKAAIFVACSAVASKDEDGSFVGTEIMLCNVTSKKKIQAELIERTHELERVTEFCRTSLENLHEIVQRGATREELTGILAEMQTKLNQTSA